MASIEALAMKARASINDTDRAFYSRNEPPVELQSHPGYPLLVDPQQRAANEHFGVLRTRLLTARAQSGICSVMIASPQRQDGKSLTSTNLAISLAQLRSERILLVDGDLRLHGVTRLLGVQERSGLSDFLQERAAFRDCIKATSLPHLFVAPAGNVSEESLPAILEGGKWLEFLQKAKQEFGLIIVDSVPVSAPIADFELLLAGCDAVLLVVHFRKTTRDAMDFTAQRMNGKLLGVIVNNFERRSDFDYRSYYSGKKPKRGT
jgi:protein-tyrosine kinase